jgi:hypothetical protein
MTKDKLIFIKIIILLFTSSIIISCSSNKFDVKLNENLEDVKLLHYDEVLFENNPYNIHTKLDSLAKIYPVFINGDYKNDAAVNGLIEYIQNPLNQKLYQECKNQESKFKNAEEEITLSFKYFQHYFSDKKLPHIYFYISGLNYEEPIIIADSLTILVGKDLFLGSKYPIYGQYQIPLFVSQKFDTKFLAFQIMRRYLYQTFSKNLKGKNLIENIIALGKVEYILHALFPNNTTEEILNFTPEQMNWCEQKEKAFWQHLADEQMLFNEDYHAYKKYIEDRPFISSLEKDSPGRAGIWIGYRIIEQYMDNKNITITQLMETNDMMGIFNEAKYKP